MPQQYPSRSAQRKTRTPRTGVRVLKAGVLAATAAALTATSAVPTKIVSASASPKADERTAAGVALAPPATESTPALTHPQAAAEVITHASSIMAKAEHLTTEGAGAPAEAIAEITQTTSVVRELVRRVSTSASAEAAPTATTPTPAPTTLPGTVSIETTREIDLGAATVMQDDTTEDATDTDTAPTVETAAAAEIAAAADAAVTAVVGAQTPTAEATPDAVTAALEQQTAALTELIAATPATAIAVTPAPPTPEEVAAQKAAEAAADAARLAALAQEAKQYGNGQIPQHLLAELAWAPGEVLRADAAAQLARLNEAFAAHFGQDLSVTDTYRSFADQVAVKRSRGKWAATPGYSNHGYGVAVDLGGGIESFGTAEYQWMRAHAGDFGWENPDWAQAGGRKPEAWHWEFVG